MNNKIKKIISLIFISAIFFLCFSESSDAETRIIDQSKIIHRTVDGSTLIGVITIEEVEGIIETSLEAVIDPAPNPGYGQSVGLNTNLSSNIQSIEINLSKEILQNLVNIYSATSTFEFRVSAHKASTKQRSLEARGNMFLVDFDVFSINLSVDGNRISNFSDPIGLVFYVADLLEKEKLKVYHYNEVTQQWEILGEGGNYISQKIKVETYNLSDFCLMKEVKTIPEEEEDPSASSGQGEEEGAVEELDLVWERILEDAQAAQSSGYDLDTFIEYNETMKNAQAQLTSMEKYTNLLVIGQNISINSIYAINNFIVYGTKSTLPLGAGERAGVVGSYFGAFGKLPQTIDEWRDCIAISNGRWSTERSLVAEADAKVLFEKIYKRIPLRQNPQDDAAVNIIAYGLRPARRNLISEKVALVSFEDIFKHAPITAQDWDVVRAIAYSGATR